MATLLRGEVPCVLQAAEHEQYRNAYRPPGVPLREVRRGPYDGQRGAVMRTPDGTLPRTLALARGRIVYVLDREADGVATYRYAPAQSPAHRPLMDAVAEQYAEHAARRAQEGQQR
ncbi:hypothetical protein [Streptomyces sp. NPDC093097]|uniref:hypothetical protein n=1 Tax=Streptomyces sp. NPDC093097 TaxID=3366027 RepID=UPI00380CC12B